MNENKNELNDAILNKIHLQDWKSRLLTSVALGVGILCIAAGIFLMWGTSYAVLPQVQLLVKQQRAAQAQSMNSTAPSVTSTNAVDESLILSDGTIVDRHVLVTLMLGKAAYITSRAVALLGAGTLLTLLLVIFNRRGTLRQINISLAQISAQIKELQNHRGSGS
jgi:hydrogenase-4 membrane subunit HyfE